MPGEMAAAGMAMNWLNGYLKARTQKAISDAQGITDDANTYSQNLINNTNADAANMVRGANNTLAAAQSAFGNLQRSIGNQNKLNAAGRQLDENEQNLARMQDAMTRGSLEDGLRAAEQMGALHAQAAMQGVGGASATMLHQTLALHAARQKTTADNNSGLQTYDMIQQRMGLKRNMVQSLDQGQTFAPIDYSVNVAPLVQSPLRTEQFAGSATSQAWVSALTGGGGGGAESLMQSISSYFPSSASGQSNVLDMNDGWNTFNTRNFSSTPGLGSGLYELKSGSSNNFFSTGDLWSGQGGPKFRLD